MNALRTLRPRPRPAQGFTLIELMVTITLLAILMGLAAPAFRTWMRNNQIRSVAESLQSGVRLAQAEAVRRNRQVVFSLTNARPSGAVNVAAAANGVNWTLQTVPPISNAPEGPAYIGGGALSEVSSANQITVEGPATLCFNSNGRQVANATPGTGVACTVAATQTYNISLSNLVAGEDRPLRVTVALGGQVRMCDPSFTLSATHPQGCPA